MNDIHQKRFAFPLSGSQRMYQPGAVATLAIFQGPSLLQGFEFSSFLLLFKSLTKFILMTFIPGHLHSGKSHLSYMLISSHFGFSSLVFWRLHLLQSKNCVLSRIDMIMAIRFVRAYRSILPGVDMPGILYHENVQRNK